MGRLRLDWTHTLAPLLTSSSFRLFLFHIISSEKSTVQHQNVFCVQTIPGTSLAQVHISPELDSADDSKPHPSHSTPKASSFHLVRYNFSSTLFSTQTSLKYMPMICILLVSLPVLLPNNPAITPLPHPPSKHSSFFNPPRQDRIHHPQINLSSLILRS